MKTESKRGRPRQFDEEIVLDQIMQVFWRHGYAATSLDQIAAATGLNRPSLYSAFGSKKAMYLKVIERFADQMHIHLREAGLSQTGANARMKEILSAAIDLYTGKSFHTDAAYGCFAITTLPAEIMDDTDFQSALSQVLTRTDRGFASLIRYEANGAMAEQDIQEVAQQLALVLHGLSIRARAGDSPDLLKRLAASAVDRLLPETSKSVVER
ncbi:TetR family transcriptional regulator [Labrenzia sp. VG12]|nr:TetR family transcriptional regulator [Labrenzia sp. VG12]